MLAGRAAAATLRRSRCGSGAGRDGGPRAGLAGERGMAGRGRRWGPERWPGEVAPRGWRGPMLLVLCFGREVRAAAPAASIRLQGVTHRSLGRLGPGGFQVTHLGRPRQSETSACSLRDSDEKFSA